MRILGISDSHNAAACLYQDGRIVAAIQEERLRRVKNWAGMPTQAIAFVLKESGLKSADVDRVAINGYHAAFPMTREQLMDEYRHINDLDVTVKRKARRFAQGAAKSLGLLEHYRARRRENRAK